MGVFQSSGYRGRLAATKITDGIMQNNHREIIIQIGHNELIPWLHISLLQLESILEISSWTIWAHHTLVRKKKEKNKWILDITNNGNQLNATGNKDLQEEA